MAQLNELIVAIVEEKEVTEQESKALRVNKTSWMGEYRCQIWLTGTSGF